MDQRPASDAETDVLVCADILGAFGVTPATLREQVAATSDTARWTDDTEDDDESDIESILSAVFDGSRERTTVLRRTIAQSPRGIDCSARYADSTLAEALVGVFEASGWSATLNLAAGVDGFDLEVIDPSGRTRKATASYPSTPLGTDNLPAILETIETAVLPGTDAEFVLLTSGTDRWQAALVETTAIERLRNMYGEHISINSSEHPLLCPYGLEAYVPDSRGCSQSDTERHAATTAVHTATADDSPWPAWALERAGNRKRRSTRPSDTPSADNRESAAVIEEADIASPVDGKRRVTEEETDRTASGNGTQSTLTDYWEFDASNRESTEDRTPSPPGESEVESLIGRVQPARVSNDSFGAETSPPRTNGY